MNEQSALTLFECSTPDSEDDAIDNNESGTCEEPDSRGPSEPMEDWEYYF